MRKIKSEVRIDIIHAKQDYRLTTDSRGVIIDRSPIPKDNDFLFMKLADVFKKWGHLVKFEEAGTAPYPPSSNDKYNNMIKKNPTLAKLKEKFNCEVY